MSMYTQLLEAGLENLQFSDSQQTNGEALAELLRCKAGLDIESTLRSGTVDVLGAVSAELAYDIALIAFVRCLGMSPDLRGFEQPQHERRILEKELTDRGVHIDQLDGQAPSLAELR